MWTSVARWNVEDQTIFELAVTGGKLQEFHGVELSWGIRKTNEQFKDMLRSIFPFGNVSW